MDEFRELGNKLDGVKDRLIVIETKMDAFQSMQNKLDITVKTADDALTSTKSAHMRIDSIEEGKRWMWRTIGAALIVQIIVVFVIAAKYVIIEGVK